MDVNLLRWLPAFRDLDYEQTTTVTNCTKPGKLLVYGPAGSGKTAITLFAAKTLYDQKRTFKIVVYTNVLLRFITAGAADLNLPSDSATTLYSWVWKLHKDQLGNPPDTGDDKYSVWVDALLSYWRSHPSQIPRYDYLLVDEAQDFKPNVAALLCMMSKNIVVAADLAQSLYENIQDRETLQSRWAPLNTTHEVRHNYRNPKSIAALAAVFLTPSKGSKADFLDRVKGRTGETPPIWYQLSNHSEQIDRICDIIGQARGSVRVGIFYRRRKHLDEAQRLLVQRGVRVQVALDRNGTYDFNNSLPVLTTAHSAKGLEFDWVILPGLDDDKWDGDPHDVNERNLFFVALTRTKEKLYLFSTKDKECSFMREILTNHRNLIQTPGSQATVRTYASTTPTIAPDDDDPF